MLLHPDHLRHPQPMFFSFLKSVFFFGGGGGEGLVPKKSFFSIKIGEFAVLKNSSKIDEINIFHFKSTVPNPVEMRSLLAKRQLKLWLHLTGSAISIDAAVFASPCGNSRLLSTFSGFHIDPGATLLDLDVS